MKGLKEKYDGLKIYFNDVLTINDRDLLYSYKDIDMAKAQKELNHLILSIDNIVCDMIKVTNNAELTAENIGVKLYAIKDKQRQYDLFKRHVKAITREERQKVELEEMEYSVKEINDVIKFMQDEGIIKLMDYIHFLETNKEIKEYCNWYFENESTCDLKYMDKSLELFDFICDFRNTLLSKIETSLKVLQFICERIIEDMEYIQKEADRYKDILKFYKSKIVYEGVEFKSVIRGIDHRSYSQYKQFLKLRRNISKNLNNGYINDMEDEHSMFLNKMEEVNPSMYESFMNDWY